MWHSRMSTIRCRPPSRNPSTAPLAVRNAQSGASARIGRRQMRRQHLSDRHPLPFGSVHHAIGDELPQGGLVGMLELATATGREMATGRRDVMRARGQCPITSNRVARRRARDMATRCGNPITARRDPFDGFTGAHRNTPSPVSARAQDHPREGGTAPRAASWCSQTASFAARAGLPCSASRDATIPASTSPCP